MARIRERHGARYAQRPHEAFADTTDDFVPQRALVPGVHDPNLWMVRCVPGKEQEVIMAITKRFIEREMTSHPLDISSVFSRDSPKGYVYVEARKQAYVQNVSNGVAVRGTRCVQERR